MSQMRRVCVCFRVRVCVLKSVYTSQSAEQLAVQLAVRMSTFYSRLYNWLVPVSLSQQYATVLKGKVKICHKKTTTTSHRSVSSAISTGLPLISSKHTDRPRYKCGIEWRGGATAGHRTCDQEVAVSSPGPAWLRNDSGQVVHTHTSLLPSSIIWYLESWNVNTHTHIRLTALFPGLPG